MRRFAALFLLVGATVTVIAAPVRAQSHPDFSGKWTMDASKSIGEMLPSASTVVVAQNDQALTADRSAQDGMGIEATTLTYALDTTASTNHMKAQGEMLDLFSKVDWDGPVLVITTETQFGGQPVEQIDRWSLDAEKKILTIVTSVDVGGQQIGQKIVYTKM